MQLKQVLSDLLSENSPHNNFTIIDTAKRIYGHFDDGKIIMAVSSSKPADKNQLIKTVGLSERERIFTAIHENLYPPVVKEPVIEEPVIEEPVVQKTTKKKTNA